MSTNPPEFLRKPGKPTSSLGKKGAVFPANAGEKAEAFSGIHVLIVDDMPTNRKVLQHLIRKLGAEPETCESGEEALKLHANNLYHLILLDLHMPTMSGFEVGEKIISSRDGQLPLVVAQTADETPQACNRTSDIGFDGHLTKPIRPARVSEILKSIKTFLSTN